MDDIKKENGRTYLWDDKHKEWVDITPSEKMKKLLKEGYFVPLK